MIDHKAALLDYYSSGFNSFYSGYFQPQNVDEWKVICPFHDDKNPSMSINIKTGLFSCHACKAGGDFIKFYMNKTGKDFKTSVSDMCRDLGIEPKETVKVEKKIVETYDYYDEQGRFVSQTVRFEPKQFSQRTYKDGKTVWSLKGVNTVLYNLVDVIKSDTVLILEGEKDCETAREMGFIGTTSPMGAGKWKEEYDKYLYGKEIILFPDNDAPGIKHMLDIGRRLESKSTVKWFDFAKYKKEKFDFTDFIETLGEDARERIHTELRSARKFDPTKIIIPEPDTKESRQIKDWIIASPGEFTTRDVDFDMGFITPEQKQKRTNILEKFVSEKILSREGTKRGHYRPYKKELETIDFMKADDSFIDIWLPMKIHGMVGIMPGNIIVFAGEPNAGKTALLLNIIKANMDRFNVHYFNSEMGGGELKNRLSKFEDIPLVRWKFNSYSRDADFADVVFQGEKSLNIIDFLEVHDDFYKVGEKIKDIHSALNGGIAIIAIQKNKGSEMGLGGNRTMEKARLVVNVEPGKFKITKAKNFIDPKLNPNGLSYDWKLVNGCQFKSNCAGWYKEVLVKKGEIK